MAVVPIIIPFYKEHDKLAKCKAAIAAQTWKDCELFVRDNTHDNILFTAAVNEGLARYCRRDDVQYVIVLNQDAYMQKDCVAQLVAFMDAHPECGIACPIQYQEMGGGVHWDGRGMLKVNRGRAVTWGGSLDAFPLGVHRHDDLASYTTPFETWWANGACMMIRMDTIRECGFLDKNLRFICSDSDFSFTARARGWKVFVVPSALCEHSLGASGASSISAIDLVKLQDLVYFTEKWLTGGLYKSLSYEGSKLTGIGVRQWLEQVKRNIVTVQRMLGEKPGEAAAFPSYSLPIPEAAPSPFGAAFRR
jgi:GT2 family glycosyltransferase